MAVLCVFLAVACGFDYRYKKIPNLLVAAMAAVGACRGLVWGGAWGLTCCVGAGVLAMCILYPLFKIGAVGAGDVKLLGTAAGYFPFKSFLVFLFISLLVAAVISLVKMLKKGYFLERMAYFLEYVRDVAKSGRFKLYLQNEQDRRAVGICLSGPVLVSVLMYMGGIY